MVGSISLCIQNPHSGAKRRVRCPTQEATNAITFQMMEIHSTVVSAPITTIFAHWHTWGRIGRQISFLGDGVETDNLTNAWEGDGSDQADWKLGLYFNET